MFSPLNEADFSMSHKITQKGNDKSPPDAPDTSVGTQDFL